MQTGTSAAGHCTTRRGLHGKVVGKEEKEEGWAEAANGRYREMQSGKKEGKRRQEGANTKGVPEQERAYYAVAEL